MGLNPSKYEQPETKVRKVSHTVFKRKRKKGYSRSKKPNNKIGKKKY